MPNPSRASTAGRIYNDLRNLARRSGAPTDQVMLEYLLELFHRNPSARVLRQPLEPKRPSAGPRHASLIRAAWYLTVASKDRSKARRFNRSFRPRRQQGNTRCCLKKLDVSSGRYINRLPLQACRHGSQLTVGQGAASRPHDECRLRTDRDLRVSVVHDFARIRVAL